MPISNIDSLDDEIISIDADIIKPAKKRSFEEKQKELRIESDINLVLDTIDRRKPNLSDINDKNFTIKFRKWTAYMMNRIEYLIAYADSYVWGNTPLNKLMGIDTYINIVKSSRIGVGLTGVSLLSVMVYELIKYIKMKKKRN